MSIIEKSLPAPESSKLHKNVMIMAKGGSFKFAGVVFEYTTRFVFGVLMVRWMGAEQFGLYNLGEASWYLITGLVGLGFTEAIIRYVALFASRRDEKSIWGTLQVGVLIPVAISVFAAAI